MICPTFFLKPLPRFAFSLAVFSIGLGYTLEADPPPTGALVDGILDAKAAFVPVTEEHVASALDRTERSLLQVHAFVDRDPPTGQRWKRYLDSGEQIRRIEEGTDQDPEFWQRILRRVQVDSAGLEEPVFREYRRAVRELIGRLRARQSPDLQAEYETALDRLAAAVAAFSENPSRGVAGEISALLTLLYRQHRAEDLVRVVRQSLSHPNLMVRIPMRMASSRIDGTTETMSPVEDVIAGARVRGTARMTAERTAVFSENDDGLQVNINVSGVSRSRTRGFRQGVTTYHSGRLLFASSSSLEFNERGFEISPFVTSATLQSRLLGISTRLRGIRRLVAQRRARDRQRYARREAESKAIYQLSRGFEEELSGLLEPLNETYRQELRRPLLRSDLFPSGSQFGFQDKRLELAYFFDLGYRLAAIGPPPAHDAEDMVEIAIHESAFNNSFSSYLPGRRMALTELLGNLFGRQAMSASGSPDRDDEAPLILTFADQLPLSVVLDDRLLMLSLNPRQFEIAGQRYAAMEIRLKYALGQEDGQWVLKADDPAVLMPLRADGSRPRLGIRNYSLRRILRNTIARDQPPRLFLDQMLVSFLATPSLELDHARLQSGWLQVHLRETSTDSRSKPLWVAGRGL